MPRRPASVTQADSRALAPVRFGLSAVEAAEAIGVSATLFRAMVDDRRMPRPRAINTRQVWDIDELRAAFKALPHSGGSPADGDEVDTWADVA